MVGYQNIKNLNKEVLKQFAKHSKFVGVIFILLGLVGILYSPIMSVATAYFVAWLFVFSGFWVAFHTWNTDRKDWLGWLKAFIYILTGILVSIFPFPGVAALAIILAVYFFFDGFASFALAYQMKGEKYWWLILLNGILSIVLGVLFLTGWPVNSLILVGLFVGISLFFDGIILLTMGSYAKKLEEEIDSDKKTSNNQTDSKA
ncbi:HdeD family acid-resistance protein [Nitrosophilus alvini]|uniref:HdeD family acid-resistance protein n=1 Tax=Nitrosophilus alvini TaxID=2714855 RepID=UPI00190C2485|nr:DUF308 domain-containing protein [Nitrosophilus alvini]